MAKRWQVMASAPTSLAEEYPEGLPVIRQLLYNRGLTKRLEIEHFLYPELQLKSYDPFAFRDMEAAVSLVIKHLKERHTIAIAGDYDADGVSSSALLAETLRALGGEVEVWIPSRFGQGYGLSKQIVDEINAQGCSLIITVDNGIRAKVEAEYAESLGLDIIVTDHHEGPAAKADYPSCLVIDPILEDEAYPFKLLCGAGVAFKFAQALISRSTLSEEQKEALLEKVIDLAAVGTVADCVALLGENRLLVQQGLDLINRRPRLGLRELMRVSKITPGEVDEWNISWQITPRLNVAGRLAHANAAFELLSTKDVTEARRLADELNEKNIERQAMTAAIVEAASKMVEADQAGDSLLVAVAPDLSPGGGESWNEGVIGLAAGRIAERFSRPCLVICQSEGKIKGSGRSIEQCNLVAALEAGKEHLERYGGHKMACGFTVKSVEDLWFFIEKVKLSVETELSGVDLSPVLWIDAELPLREVNDDLIEMIERFAPFGQSNPQPKFLSRAEIEEVSIMGKEKTHIKFRLGGMWALGFSKAEEWKDFEAGQEIDVVYTLCFNIFNGRREAQLKIVDLRPAA